MSIGYIYKILNICYYDCENKGEHNEILIRTCLLLLSSWKMMCFFEEVLECNGFVRLGFWNVQGWLHSSILLWSLVLIFIIGDFLWGILEMFWLSTQNISEIFSENKDNYFMIVCR